MPPKDIGQQIKSISSPNELYVFAYKREETDPQSAIAAYESILERFPSSDVAIKATERIDRLKGTQSRETAKASRWRGRIVRFSELFTYKVSTGSGLLDTLAGGGLSESFEVTFEAVIEEELGNDLKVIIKSAEVSGGKSSIMGIDAARAYSREVINSSLGRTRVMSKSVFKTPLPIEDSDNIINASRSQSTPAGPEVTVQPHLGLRNLDREEVQIVQLLLAELGYSPGPADGIVGTTANSKTRAAIRDFQCTHDLPLTGNATSKLLEVLILVRDMKEMSPNKLYAGAVKYETQQETSIAQILYDYLLMTYPISDEAVRSIARRGY
jgi:hypothetical protein